MNPAIPSNKTDLSLDSTTFLVCGLGGLDYPLYKHQAQRLVNELSKAQVLAHLVCREIE